MSVSVSLNQSDNAILAHILQVPHNIVDDIAVDFSPNSATGILFLSMSYHRLHPEYIENKFEGYYSYKLKILLIKLDVADYSGTLKDLYTMATQYKFKCMVGANDQECGLVVETLAIYANKPADFLLPRTLNDDYLNNVQTTLTSIKGINKSDALTLISKFKSIKRLSKATQAELADCPGIADTKVSRIVGLFQSKLI